VSARKGKAPAKKSPSDAPKRGPGRPRNPPKPPPPPKEESARAGGLKAGTGRGLYRPEYVSIARKMCQMGAIDKDLAEAFGVSDRAIKDWRAAHPDFAEACAIGKEAADDMVERALFHRAIGYEHPAEKIFNNNGTIVRAETVEHYPPDTAAAFIWLKNRKPKSWRDRQEIEVTDLTATGEALRKARERLKKAQGSSDAG
jgi:hypothetical protein